MAKTSRALRTLANDLYRSLPEDVRAIADLPATEIPFLDREDLDRYDALDQR